MNLGQTIRKGTAWLFAGKLADRVLQFAIGIVLARLLVPADFGMLVTMSIFTGVASFVAGGGMGEALVQAKQVEEFHYRVVFTIQLLICLVIYWFFYNISPYFAAWFNEPQYEDLLRVSALTFLIRPFSNIPNSRLRREMRFKFIAINSIATLLVGGVISIAMALNGYGPWSLVIGGLTGGLVNVVLLLAETRWLPGIRYSVDVARSLGTYGIKMSLVSIVEYLRKQTSNLLLSRTLGPSAVGLFNKADSLSILPAEIVAGTTYQTVFRALSTTQDDMNTSRYIYYRSICLISVYSMPFYVGLLITAEAFLTGLYGEKWSSAAIALQILSLTGIFRGIMSPAGAVAAAQNRLGTELRIQIETWVIFALGCGLGLKWGIEGVAWGILPGYAYLTVRITQLAQACVGGGAKSLLQALLPAVILNSLLLFVLLVTDNLVLSADYRTTYPLGYLLIMCFVGGVTYGGAFLFAPISMLESEAMRWKKLLRLVK